MKPKFRVWDKLTNTMRWVKEIEFGSKGARIIRLSNIEPNCYDNNKRWHSSVILMQSTDLKDACKTEIYEKDIVRNSYGDLFLVEWLNGAFVLTEHYNGGCDQYYIYNSSNLEVVGNEYENLELMEEIAE
ncbi:YopX family protein [Staphylococcus hyicus]|uniref:YopX family protein n=1 Tax=Staphylococcus hyicus TaxID=1284 RepID=UPI00236678CD|nr:YopX family protein [Staphylococcus hyicus]